MTKTPELDRIEKLAGRVAGECGSEDKAPELYPLARECADCCAAVNERLQRCADLIALGGDKDYEALKLASLSPDAVAAGKILGDSNLDAWREFCRKNYLPVPEAIDRRAMEALEPVYANTMSFRERLYGEFGEAQLKRDFEVALRIIRRISSLNPDDASAAKQAKKLESRILTELVEQLESPVEASDLEKVTEIVERAENWFAERRPGGEVWDRALQMRNEFLGEKAEAECRASLSEAEDARDEGQVARVVELTGKTIERKEKYSLTLETRLEEALDDLTAWAKGELRREREEEAFQSAIGEFKACLGEIAKGMNGRPMEKLREDEKRVGEFSRRVAKFGKPVPEDLTAARERTSGELRGAIGRLEGARKRKIAMICAAAAFVVIAASLYAFASAKAGSLTRTLDEGMAEQRAIAIEEAVGSAKGGILPLLRFGNLSETVAKSEAWLEAERAKAKVLGEQIDRLEKDAGDGFKGIEPMAFQKRLELGRDGLEQVTPDYRGEAEARLATIGDAWIGYLAGIKATITGEFRDKMTALKDGFRQGGDYGKAPKDVAEAVRLARESMRELDYQASHEVEGLRPPERDIEELADLREQLAEFEDQIALIRGITDDCIEAQDLNAYFEAVDRLVESKFMRGEQLNAYRSLRAKVRTLDDFLKLVLMPDDDATWSDFVLNKPTGKGYPDEISSKSKEMFYNLRDNPDLKNVYRYTYDGSDNRTGTPLYSRGQLRVDRATVGDGRTRNTVTGKEAYASWQSEDVVIFKEISYSQTVFGAGSSGAVPTNEKLTAESEFFDELGLSAYVNGSVTAYEKTLLGAIDRISAAEGLNPLFRAYLHLRIGQIVMQQPTHFGLQWTTFVEDLERLEGAAGVGLSASDWMAPRKIERLGPAAAAYYDALGATSYGKQAKSLSSFFSKIYGSGFTFAGFVDYEGQIQVLPGSRDKSELWGLGDDLSAAVLFRKPEGGGEFEEARSPKLLTPLFHANLEPGEFLAQACAAVEISPDDPAIVNHLPPAFRTGP